MSRPPTLDLPDGTRASRMATRRGDFAVHDIGRAEHGTVLLVPGYTGSKEDFLGLLKPVAQAGFRAVAVDGRGQHESGGPRDETAYARDELADDLLAQAEALGGRVHLVGHSLGGLIARSAVLRDASPIASLTLMSSGPAAISRSQQLRVRLLLKGLAVLDMETVWRAMRVFDRFSGPAAKSPLEPVNEAVPPAVLAFLHQRWLNTVPEQLKATGRQLLKEPDRVAELARVPMRMHVLSGERDDAWPVAWMDEMARRLRARRTVIAGAQHSPNADRPLETARELVSGWHAAAEPHPPDRP
ncbi:alpha/beta fold hydrolase [Streptomyces sp. N2-109]|uniref:Alpha/beta fold hydrolase n=1 Tax=Streptomyces gossypii TaxID=2883101 RepID=A0ABT2JW52_9ACTN|nr:alpha/beta hydrolase [Streptomyces gossypii]MCT2591903.1 alpha/beta fold hydrolase [Streptomyces gossypii]